MPRFELDSAYAPTADQPAAIAVAGRGHRGGRALHDAARRHRHGQDDDDGRRRSRRCRGRRWSSPTTRRSPRSSATSSARTSRATRSSTSSPTTTTTSPRRTSRRRDLYIEKDSAINQEIDRLRHAATAALFARRDVIIVACVSCIFGLGSPETYDEQHADPQARRRGRPRRAPAQARLASSTRATTSRSGAARSACAATRSRSSRPTPRPALPRDASSATRSSACSTSTRSPARCSRTTSSTSRSGPPRTTTSRRARSSARWPRSARELNERCAELEAEGKLLESHRLRQRTQYDMEMLREMGFCSGIENYSRILDGRKPGERPVLPDRLLPRRLRLLHRRVAPDRAADRRHVRGRPLAQADARRLRLPPAERARQPARRPSTSSWRSRRRSCSCRPRPGDFERTHSAADRRADRPPDRHRRPRGRGARDAQPDRRPDERDPRPRRARRARARHHAHEEDVRGPHRLPARDGLQGPLPALRGRHARADPDHPRAAAGRVRRARRRQPAARGPRPAGGLAGGDPRRRQGGLPARRDVADPDDRPRGAQRRGQGAHVRRQGDGGDAGGALARPTAAARSRSPTTRSTGSRPRRSSRASPTSPSSCRASPRCREGGAARRRKRDAER